MVRTVPNVSSATGQAARRALADARDGSVVRAVSPRRPNGRGRRLSRDPPRSGRGTPASGGGGPDLRRSVDGADGRVHGVGRDADPRSAIRARARRRARRRDADRLPARHVRPRRADAPDHSARGHGARGGVARRAGRGRGDRVLVGGTRRLTRARRIPLRVVFERPRPAARRESRSCCGQSTTSTSWGPLGSVRCSS